MNKHGDELDEYKGWELGCGYEFDEYGGMRDGGARHKNSCM